MVLESPFYGSRKPHYQFASQLLRVSDLLTLGRSTIEESLCLLNWAGRHRFARLGTTAQATVTSWVINAACLHLQINMLQSRCQHGHCSVTVCELMFLGIPVIATVILVLSKLL